MKNPLEKFREQSGLSYREIAIRIGTRCHNTPYLHCRGLRKISAEFAIKYHNALGIPLSDLRPDLWPPDPAREEVEA